MASFELRNFQGAALEGMRRRAVGRALFKGASHILNQANNIAPKDEGPLIQTSGVSVDENAGKATVYYVQKYAPRLHENPQFKFQGGRQGKWLEKTVLNEGQEVGEMMAAEVRAEFGG